MLKEGVHFRLRLGTGFSLGPAGVRQEEAGPFSGSLSLKCGCQARSVEAAGQNQGHPGSRDSLLKKRNAIEGRGTVNMRGCGQCEVFWAQGKRTLISRGRRKDIIGGWRHIGIVGVGDNRGFEVTVLNELKEDEGLMKQC